jgi:predicted Zn-ribbon and HTH transcriptional regulator
LPEAKPKHAALAFFLRGLEELDRFPSPEARAAAIDDLGAEGNREGVLGFVRGLAISAGAALAVIAAIRFGLAPLLTTMVSPTLVRDLAMVAGIATMIVMVRWLHRAGAARALRRKLVALGIPVCIGCGHDLRGLSASTRRCPECGAEMTEAVGAAIDRGDGR